jgi:6-pyruvoyltetrahydropterin/6-carboxytetrahydropterin synthase
VITATRRIEIDAGHRLLRHDGKCRHAHGHRYAFEVTVEAELDAVGRVVDFSVIKERVGAWLDEHWDHAFICQTGDPLLVSLRELELRHAEVAFSPTAENLARHVAQIAQSLLPGLAVRSVRCWETPNCVAEWKA